MNATATRRRAVSAGCQRSYRSRVTRQRYGRVVAALVRVGHGGLLAPSIRETEIMRVLHGLAAAGEPQSDEGAAIRGTLVRVPRSLTMFLRRNRKWLSETIAGARKDAGLPP